MNYSCYVAIDIVDHRSKEELLEDYLKTIDLLTIFGENKLRKKGEMLTIEK